MKMKTLSVSDPRIDLGSIATIARPVSLSSDQYRVLFAKIDLHCRPDGKKIIAVTSTVKREGKTTTIANLTVVCARDFGKRCLLIDGDVRHPNIATIFQIAEAPGLVDVVEKRCLLENAMKRGPVEHLTLLTLGGSGEQGGRLWASDVIRNLLGEARGWFDYIFIDSPPILSHADINLITEFSDGVLLVVRAGLAEEALLDQAVKSLGRSKIIGSVLNGEKDEWPVRSYHQYGYY